MVHKINTHADDEVPQDLKAFFGHPLNCSYDSNHSDALALLHEYKNLPAIDKSKTDGLFAANESVESTLQAQPK